MIDSSDIAKGRGRKARREPRPANTFVAKSCPQDDDRFEELDFPGPSAAYRGEGKRPRVGSFYLDRPKKSECVPAELNLEEMAYTGYWRCLSPCHHIQPFEQGECCEKCSRKMNWEGAVPK